MLRGILVGLDGSPYSEAAVADISALGTFSFYSKSEVAGSLRIAYRTVDGKLHEFAELPSGGDTSYPGFVQLSPNRAAMSWYSSHETDDDGQQITAIYMADLEVE